MIREDVRTLEQIPFSRISLTDDGETWYEICRALHDLALVAHYGDKVPQPQAAMDNNLVLHLWWDCGGHPLVIRVDEFLWELL